MKKVSCLTLDGRCLGDIRDFFDAEVVFRNESSLDVSGHQFCRILTGICNGLLLE